MVGQGTPPLASPHSFCSWKRRATDAKDRQGSQGPMKGNSKQRGNKEEWGAERKEESKERAQERGEG